MSWIIRACQICPADRAATVVRTVAASKLAPRSMRGSPCPPGAGWHRSFNSQCRPCRAWAAFTAACGSVHCAATARRLKPSNSLNATVPMSLKPFPTPPQSRTIRSSVGTPATCRRSCMDPSLAGPCKGSCGKSCAVTTCGSRGTNCRPEGSSGLATTCRAAGWLSRGWAGLCRPRWASTGSFLREATLNTGPSGVSDTCPADRRPSGHSNLPEAGCAGPSPGSGNCKRGRIDASAPPGGPPHGRHAETRRFRRSKPEAAGAGRSSGPGRESIPGDSCGAGCRSVLGVDGPGMCTGMRTLPG